MNCHPSRKPKMYMVTASAWERYSGRPTLPPTSRPRDWEMME